jgi:hypothetical protein
MRNLYWMVAAAGLLSCGKGGDTAVLLTHESPAFKAQVPGNLKVGKDKPSEGGGANLSVANDDLSQEVFFIWAKTGSAYDPVPQFGRHKKHADLTKVIAEGDLPGGKGKFIQVERGSRTYVHAVASSGGFGIECTASYPTASTPAPVYVDACKTLEPL